MKIHALAMRAHAPTACVAIAASLVAFLLVFLVAAAFG